MNKQDCFELGLITKTHGLKGFVTVYIESDNPQDYYNLESVFLEHREELIPFFIEDFKESNSPEKIQVKFEDVDSIEDAQEIIKSKIYLPLDWLPELRGDKFYYHEVIGFELNDTESGKSGKIENILGNMGKDYFSVDINNELVLIPIEDSFNITVDRAKETITVDLPEGLLDI